MLLGPSFPFIKRIGSASVIAKAFFVSKNLCLQIMFQFTYLEPFPFTYVLKTFLFLFHVLCLMVVCSFKFGAKTSVLLIHRHGIWVKTENDKQNPKNTALGNPLYSLTIKSCFTRMSWPVQANPKASERAEASLSFQNFA